MIPVASVSRAIAASTNPIQGNSNDEYVTVTEAREKGIRDGCCGDVGSAKTIPGSSREEDNDGIKDERVGVNRWPRQETLALLKIRSEMDAAFRDACLKYPLWEEVSRKMAELGYQRSAKKCQVKFQNIFYCHKRTKEGRISKANGKTSRFFNELDTSREDERVGVNRWPRQETLALLKIRSEMDAAFRDACLKYPLWEEVSRKMAELGYQRSAKKCRVKFRNIFYCHKRTKEGRISKANGKTSREDNDLLYLDKRTMPRLSDDFGVRREHNDSPRNFLQDTQPLSVSPVQWKNMQKDPSLPNSTQSYNLLYLSRPVLHFPPENCVQFCTKRVAYSPTGDQFQNLPAESLDSVNQPQPELSSSTSVDVSHFRKLLRQVTYGNESTSINQALSTDMTETCLELKL